MTQKVVASRQPVFGRRHIARKRHRRQLDDRADLHKHVAGATGILQRGFGRFMRSLRVTRVQQRTRFEQRQVWMCASNSVWQELEGDQHRGPAAGAHGFGRCTAHELDGAVELAELLACSDNADWVRGLFGQLPRH